MKKAECIIATFAGRPLDVGKWGAAVPIAWRSGPGMLSPRPTPGAEDEPTTVARHPMTDPSRAHADVANLFTASLAEADPEIADVIKRELSRQRDEIELIA